MNIPLEPLVVIPAALVLAGLVQVVGRWSDRRAAAASAARVAAMVEQLRAADVDVAYRRWLVELPEIGGGRD